MKKSQSAVDNSKQCPHFDLVLDPCVSAQCNRFNVSYIWHQVSLQPCIHQLLLLSIHLFLNRGHDSRRAGCRLHNIGTTQWHCQRLMKLSHGQQSGSIFCCPHEFSTQHRLRCCKLNFWPWCFPAYWNSLCYSFSLCRFASLPLAPIRTLTTCCFLQRLRTPSPPPFFSHSERCFTHMFVQTFMHVGWYEENVFVSVVFVVDALFYFFATACECSLLHGDVTGL